MDTPDSKQQGGKPGSVTSSIQSAFKVMMNRHISWPWSPRLVYHVNPSDSVTLCTLGIGTAFGESVLDNSPHSATVVTNEYCELLRIEQRDFRSIWERNRHLMEDIVSPLSTLRTISGSTRRRESRAQSNGTLRTIPPPAPASAKTPAAETAPLPSRHPPSPTEPFHTNRLLVSQPTAQVHRAGWVLRTLLLFQAPQLIRDRKYHMRHFRRCMVGTEMVDWLLQVPATHVRLNSRAQAAGMWQVLLEEGAINHVTREHQFKDKYMFYRFREDEEEPTKLPTSEDRLQAEEELQDVLLLLMQLTPDAVLRMILRKPPMERTLDDLDLIYEELLHIKALSHLSNSVKRELYGVMIFESHPKAGTILFNQGDEGNSWYIILRGSVNVVIYGKGVVCTLHEGDDFGKLALVNDAPRAATITTREDNCHFLRVDKEDFNRILRDVEANTVRLKEHGQDVLLLQKIPADARNTNGAHSHYKYMVMAGTPQKMLEHLLETRIDTRTEESSDTFLEDFLLTHVIFMPSHQLCPELMKHYRIDLANSRQEKEFILANKRRVVQFANSWALTVREAFFEDPVIQAFVDELLKAVKEDSTKYAGCLQEELRTMTRIMDLQENVFLFRYVKEHECSAPQRWKVGPFGHIRHLSSGSTTSEDTVDVHRPIKPNDEIIFRVYCADHTYTTLKTAVSATAEFIKRNAAEKLSLKDDLVLVEVKSSGERIAFKDSEVSVPTGLSINGRIFISPADHLDALTPLSEQEGPVEGTGALLETLSSHDIAYHMSLYDWHLFSCIHEYELIYQVFGRHQFRKIMSNLDVFQRRFNEVQFWVVTEMCLANPIGRRVQLLRKFIKIASHCREYQNLNAFFAIVMGLSNVAVSRLSQTWERLPGKVKRTFAEFETLIDPSRNHRRYRVAVSKVQPPLVPFMPLLLKDITFCHEGNKTYIDGLVNFEKMHMIGQTLRSLRHSRSQRLNLEPPPPGKVQQDVREYIRTLKVIDNQRRLTQLSHALEPRRP
ncbi:rap guanine nucleotide exchange factor 4 isoform X3 [Dermacentor silvarum]|uniref:rap guanine nucleotide exchange factor 4 isoform X3 n=1 Tax=Dermacentor silvarum TaxID=543639 RepID=UPI0018975997|nr:rap guanine nucleotide exchange factor 4 isoform X3 [Dermacentor silvarum]